MVKTKFGETNPEIYFLMKALAKAGAFTCSMVSLNTEDRLHERPLHFAEQKKRARIKIQPRLISNIL